MEELNKKLSSNNKNLIKSKDANIDVLKIYENKDKKIKELNEKIKILLEQNQELKNTVENYENRFKNRDIKNKGVNTCAFVHKHVNQIPIYN